MDAAATAPSQFMDESPALKTWELPRAFKLEEDAMVFTRSQFDAAVAAGRGFDEVWTTTEQAGDSEDDRSKYLLPKGDSVFILSDNSSGPAQYLDRQKTRLDDALRLKAQELGPELKNPSSGEKYCEALQRFVVEVGDKLTNETGRWKTALQAQCQRSFDIVHKQFNRARTGQRGAFTHRLNAAASALEFFDFAPIAIKIIHGFSDEVIAEVRNATALPRVFLNSREEASVSCVIYTFWDDCKWLQEFASKTCKELSKEEIPPWVLPFTRAYHYYGAEKLHLHVDRLQNTLRKLFKKRQQRRLVRKLDKPCDVQWFCEEATDLGDLDDHNFLEFLKLITKRREEQGVPLPFTADDAIEFRLVFQEIEGIWDDSSEEGDKVDEVPAGEIEFSDEEERNSEEVSSSEEVSDGEVSSSEEVSDEEDDP
ncbi:unnamed protein product [Amoebophrya sp. A120]|nr:unnamed protein product [Amoebophrya sp. A120]|eukprot:GSA120T00003377001.1